MTKRTTLLFLLLLSAQLVAPVTASAQHTRTDITAADLRTRLFLIAGKQVIYGESVADCASWISADSARDRLVVFSTPPGAGLQSGQSVVQSRRFADAAAIVLPVMQFLPVELAASQLAGRVTTDTTRTASGPGRIFVTPMAADALLGRAMAGATPGPTSRSARTTTTWASTIPRSIMTRCACATGSHAR